MSIAATPPVERNDRKVRVGIVVSTAMKNTIVVRVARSIQHDKYERVMRRSKRFKAHDEGNTAHSGDTVSIMETRPLSRDKRWRLVEILHKASTAPIVPDGEEEIRAKALAKRKAEAISSPAPEAGPQ